MVRLTAVAAIILSGALTGLCASQRLIARVSFFEQFLAFLIQLQTQIRFSANDLSRLLTADSTANLLGPFLEQCKKTMQLENSLVQAWSQAVIHIPKTTGLTGDDKTLLNEFAAALGTTDTEGQLAHCELYKTLVEARLANAREERAKKVKLYRMLGTFSGIGVSLLIL